MRRVWRLLRWLLLVGLMLALAAGGWGYFRLRASLPRLDGELAIGGFSAPVTIERDAQGVPTIRAANAVDLARALGFLHGQDRFFQMDLLRRRAAGELAELFGQVALPLDRATRFHRFRAFAKEIWERERGGPHGPELSAYVEGVNAGRDRLGAAPFEYLLLGARPQPWTAEDSILVGYAMVLDLQDSAARTDQTRRALREEFGDDVAAFLSPATRPDDAAIDGSVGVMPPVPGADKIDLHVRPSTASAAGRAGLAEPRFGSNSFALAGARTKSGGAMIANDMHLGLSVPNIWYRASLVLPNRSAIGVTLPGVPILVVGTNGRVAWGFTNSYTGTSGATVLESNVPLKRFEEFIAVRGAPAERVEFEWAPDGPILGRDPKGRPVQLRWTFNQPAAINLALGDLVTATSTDEAVELAHRCGMAPQNILVGDTAGKIAWTIAGFLPARDGSTAFVPAAQIPVFTADALWTANNRIVGGDALRLLGDGGYESPPRAAQIRDDLQALNQPAGPADLLAVQLDDRALFLARWRQLLLDVLTPEACAAKPERGEMRRFVEGWGDRAAIDSVGYRAVRAFRGAVVTRMSAPIVEACSKRYAEFRFYRLSYEPGFWAILQSRPPNWLPSNYRSWEDLLLAAADEFPEAAKKEGKALAQMTWGARNTAQIRHPFAALLPPMLRGFLSMPAQPLSGDTDMPRVQTPNFGASERMVMVPGRENESIFHMPGGQSAHPLSPYFRAGHEDWVHGRPTPLLPGKPEHSLILR